MALVLLHVEGPRVHETETPRTSLDFHAQQEEIGLTPAAALHPPHLSSAALLQASLAQTAASVRVLSIYRLQ